MSEPIIEVKNAKKIYKMGKERIRAVDGVSFTVDKGEFCCLLGTSGSGKSTLLNLMAGIEKLSSGEILIKGESVGKMSENKLSKFRQENLGFVFQSYNLIGSMTALENVELPLVFKRVRGGKRKKLARKILKQVGLGGRMKHKPKEMSGGQQQRVGIARAFVSKPDIVFADEPTGNLDSHTTIEVMDLIKAMARKNNQTIVMVTHDRKLSEYADKIIHILDGKIESVEIVEHDMVRGDGGCGSSPESASPPECISPPDRMSSSDEKNDGMHTTVEQNPLQDSIKTEENKGIEESTEVREEETNEAN
ncbi:MAG: ABC transporter ATP-binding protein [Lachnospiraceae bacterium]|nr:ABC transporter ATP-binding protein [Lachnospiraceae bacterium]